MEQLTNTKLKLNVESEVAESIALSPAGTAVSYNNKDDGKIVLLLTNSGTAAQCTILHGNALQGTSDLEVTVPANKTAAITVESGKFVNVFGENKGQLIIKGDSTVEIQAIELP